MRQLLRTARRAPASIIGTLIALTTSATLLTVMVELAVSAHTAQLPVARLSASPVVVVGKTDVGITEGHGDNRDTTHLPLAAYRGVAPEVADRIRALPTVARVVSDVATPVSLARAGSGAGAGAQIGASAHAWDSAALTPFHLIWGHAPTRDGQVVLGAGLARTMHSRLGEQLRIDGQHLAPQQVVGIADARGTVDADTAFFTTRAAIQLHGRGAIADLLGVFPRPGTTPGTLADRLRAVTGPQVTVLTGRARGSAEDPERAGDPQTLTDFSIAGGIPIVVVSLFVVAGAVGLSVSGRRRHFALLRAVGATPGQVRRTLAAELAVLGVLGGALGYPLGGLIAHRVVAGMSQHALLPPQTATWSAWWLLPIACGACVLVAQLAGLVAGWRAGRSHPVLALQESVVDRTRPNPLRLLLGVAALGGGITAAIFTYGQAHNPTDQLNLALVTLLALVAATGLLGPVLVSLAELLLRCPAQRLGGPAARLALADIRRRPRRIASAVVAVAVSVGFLGTVYLVNVNATHADHTQTASRLRADTVITAPAGVAPSAVPALTAVPGVQAAVGVISTSAYPTLDGGDSVAAAALTPGAIDRVLDLDVTAGDLHAIRPGQIAVSHLEAGDQKVGSQLLVYLADGTPYRARICAIYDRGMGFGDVILPVAAGGGGHLGTASIGQVLLRGHPAPGELAQVAARYPGLHASSRAQANARADQLDDQSQYLNTMLVVLIGLLAVVTLLNTMATATVERRASVGLLDRVGTTTAQQVGVACWQTVTVAAVGLVTGAGAGAVALVSVSRALTGSWQPYVPVGTAAALGAGVVAVTAAAVLAPTALMLRRLRQPVVTA